MRGSLARDAASQFEQLQASTATTLVKRCDAAETMHAGRLVALTQELLGVWHAAGVLADGVLPQQTAVALSRVYAPKAHGAWALQRALAPSPLHACALFCASVFGARGGG